MNFNKTGKVFTSKFIGTGPSSYKKKNLLGHGLLKVENHCFKPQNLFMFVLEFNFAFTIERYGGQSSEK
jgi:hypothetical protein